MRPFLLSQGKNPADPGAAARNAALLNLLATPGLGSLLAGRYSAGIGQLVLAVIGFGCVIAWFGLVLWQYYGQITGDVQPTPVGWIGLSGAGIFALAWAWSLVTSLSLFSAARAASKEKPGTPSPG